MIIVKVWGGIGNQLFQYVFGQYLKYKYNQEIRYDDNSYVFTDKLRKRELDAIDAEIAYDNRCSFSKFRGVKNRLYLYGYLLSPKHHFISETTPIPTQYKEGHIYFFQGYWQDAKYYKWLLDNTSFQLRYKPLPDNLLPYSEKIKTAEESISIHIRRGDYFSPANIGTYGVCDASYFETAIQKIKADLGDKKKHFFVFTDDIDWVQKNVKLDECSTIVENFDVPQLSYIILMSQCKHHVISNSSFSWWGAVLDAATDTIVLAPRRWTLTSDKSIALTEWEKI